MQLVFRELKLNCVFSLAKDGEEAVEFILKRGAYSRSIDPDIIFLDLNLPKLTGVEVLEAIQTEKQHPVCIVSGSSSEQPFIQRRFDLDARRYILKPATRQQLLEALGCFPHLRSIVGAARVSEFE